MHALWGEPGMRAPERGLRAPEGWGTWGEELARRYVAEAGVRVLRRLPRLTHGDRDAVLDAAAGRLVRSGPPSGVTLDAHVRRTVYCEALAFDRRRLAEELDLAPEALAALLAGARERIAGLSVRERPLLLAVFALDAVADEDEAGRVVLHAAVAHQMRWNTAHQHISRAFRKLAEGALSGWGLEWRSAHRLLCDPPSMELWLCAREYLDACSGRGAHAGPAFQAWTRAHEDHNAWFNEWKKQSASATLQWRGFAHELDRGGVAPRHLVGPIVAGCKALGIDRAVIPGKVRLQSWRELLDGAQRPTPEGRNAWRGLLRAHPFGARVEAAFREVERDAALAEVASVELEAAYHRLLKAAEGRSVDGIRARDEFRRLVEAARQA